MSPPEEVGAPAATAGGAATSTTITATAKQQDHLKNNGAHRHRRDVVAVGRYAPPTGRRHLGVVIVERCPGCAHLHLHRALTVATADGTTRTGSCGTAYRLRVLPVARVGGAA